MPGARDQGVGHLVRPNQGRQRIGKQLALLGRHIAVRRAVLDQEGRRLGRDIGDRIHHPGRLRPGLDGRADQGGFGRIGGVVIHRAGGAGELRIHLKKVRRAKPIDNGLNAA